MSNWNEIPQEIREKAGAWKIENGQCPIDATTPMTCMFCQFGHMMECHYPQTCEEADCSHYQEEEDWEDKYDD